MLILRVNPLRLVAAGRPPEFAVDVVGPSDATFIDGDVLAVEAERKSVIVDSVSDGSARTGHCVGIERDPCPTFSHFHVRISHERTADRSV